MVERVDAVESRREARWVVVMMQPPARGRIIDCRRHTSPIQLELE
jgi:hypothetical protein